jgi:hypothetical protein
VFAFCYVCTPYDWYDLYDRLVERLGDVRTWVLVFFRTVFFLMRSRRWFFFFFFKKIGKVTMTKNVCKIRSMLFSSSTFKCWHVSYCTRNDMSSIYNIIFTVFSCYPCAHDYSTILYFWDRQELLKIIRKNGRHRFCKYYLRVQKCMVFKLFILFRNKI